MRRVKDLRLVEFTVVLARHRNFARAAESLGVSQPTFSRGIAALERDLGVRLFDRSTRHVELTSIGRAFVERAEALVAEASRLDDVVDDHSELLSGQLTIGSGPYPLEACVIPAVARLASAHPNLCLQVIEGPWREFFGKLLAGTIDLVVMEASIMADDQRVHLEVLPRHRGELVCRPGHPLTRRAQVSAEDLATYPLVGVPMVRELRLRVGETSARLKIDPVTGDLMPPVTTTSLTAMREIIRHTDGIGLYAAIAAEAEVHAGRLALLHADFELPSTAYGVAWLQARSPSPAALVFVQTLREVEDELAQRERMLPARVTP